MIFKRSSLRYAHITGHTSVSYTENGEFILTCGSDGDLRKWRSVDDDDPTSNCLGEYVNCIAYNGGKLFASSDHNTLQSYTFPDMDKDGTLLRFTAAVTCIRMVGKILAAGSEDTVIKVIKDEQPEQHFEGHTGPILGLDVSIDKGVLASIGGDGCLKIWNLESCAEVKTISGLATRTNSFESTTHYGTPSFEPVKQKSLVYANGRELIVLNTGSWDVQCTLSDERVTGTYTCCRFSHDGLFLAAGTSLGEISVFDFVRRETVKCEAPSSECQSITCIAWHPENNNELAYCDATGQLGSLFCDGKSLSANNDNAIASSDLIEDEAIDFGDIQFENDDDEDDRNGDKASRVFDEDDNNENCVSIEKLKKKIMSTTSPHADDDDASRDSLGTKSVHSEMATAGVKLFKQQPPFQPSSTPAHLEHRYLAWNDVGIVTLHADGADGAIDIEFNDASVHHSLHIPNYAGHTMASLSSGVVALASNNSTKLVCVALAASGNKEWSLCMPDCECIDAVAATSKLVGVATTAQQLRIFTILGTQRELISLSGPVVAMAGHEERLLVCYHGASSSESQQYISALFIQTHGMTLRSQQLVVPLAAGRVMTWLGFSDCGSPAFCDNMGLLQIFNVRSGCWHPVCDTLKHSQSISNNYFIIAVSERHQIVQAVLCRAATYPMTNPRPMMQELAMQLPLCDIESEKSQLEDVLMRAHMLVAQPGNDKVVKETAIKLFALACRSELEARAKEIIETIACPDLLSLAVKYATKLGRIHLSDRLYELHSALQDKPQPCEVFNSSAQSFASPNPNYPAVAYPSETRNKLAPKKIDLNAGGGSSASKRAQALKRFAANATASPSMVTKDMELAFSNTESIPPLNTQENIFGESMAGSDTESEIPSTEVQSKLLKQRVASVGGSGRSPLNSVNPFASSKRKLNDADFLSSGSGLANKFKMAKK